MTEIQKRALAELDVLESVARRTKPPDREQGLAAAARLRALVLRSGEERGPAARR